MAVTDETIKEYIQLYEEDFGETLTMEEAREIVTRLMALYEVLCSPLSGEQTQSVPDQEIA